MYNNRIIALSIDHMNSFIELFSSYEDDDKVVDFFLWRITKTEATAGGVRIANHPNYEIIKIDELPTMQWV